MTSASNCPRIEEPRTVREFVLRMRQLKAWSGSTLRQLERRAQSIGETLPRSTLAAALTYLRLPKEPLVIAFVKACGCSSEDVRDWVEARKTVAMKATRITDQ
ncbi:hypothetical protein GCM10009525_24390 [Streptosporangium amethystogenes subsp. fukuiense]